MKIQHIAIYVKNLAIAKQFYFDYFGGTSNEMYHNPKKQFSSYFIRFDGECSLELMHQPSRIQQNSPDNLGWHHLAFSVGSRERVDELTNLFRSKGFIIHGEPRVTGDGYYESVVLDPDGNLVEITE